MITVIGATGTIGRALVAHLVQRGAAVRALVRDPDTVNLGDVELVRGDLADPRALVAAFTGADAAFLLAPGSPALPAHDRAMLDAVAQTDVAHLVKLSAFGADTAPELASSQWHGPGERAALESGRAWTILRPAGFASNARAWLAALRSGTAIGVATGDGRHAVVDPRDVAEVAGAALVDRITGAYTLTGPAALTTHDQIAIVARALGVAPVIDDITPDVAAQRLLAQGAPAVVADAVRGGYGYVRAGRAAEVSDAVAHILGRAPRSFADWVAAHV